MGSKLKKDPEVIDREDASVIKKMQALEPRKKYALVHEDIGIVIIGKIFSIDVFILSNIDSNRGGYLLDVKTPAQKEPTTDYVFRFNGQVTRIPTIKPSRIHFGKKKLMKNETIYLSIRIFSGIYTDGDAVYVAGGQTIENT